MTMQDRFKFRVWCNREKCYLYNAEMNNAIVLTQLPDYKIAEQCTGLKDKNGKLIYEGDIVAKEFSDRPFSSKAKSKIKNCLVYWHERGEFSIKYNSDNYRCYSVPHDSFIGDCEVIGNIHENPDLLENKDE